MDMEHGWNMDTGHGHGTWRWRWTWFMHGASHEHEHENDVFTLTSTFLMYRLSLIRSLLTIRSACLDDKGAKTAWHALTMRLQPLVAI